MVAIGKKMVKGKTYYYLEQSFREGGKIQKRVTYLGDKIPKNISEIKAKFVDNIYKEKWYADADRIKKNFSKEQRTIPKSVKEKELQTFVTKFTYDTQRIEGSTLTRRETADLLERGITPKSKPLRDVKEAEAHRDLFYEILKSKKDLTLQMVLDWHWKLFHQTKADIAGKIRKYQVAIGGSKFMPPSPVEVFPMLTEFFQWYSKNKNKRHPVELAAIAHLKFVTIHPFGDGNGRVSRLVMNFILNKKDYPMLNIPYEGRNSYYNSLERSQVRKEDRIFLQWFIKRYIKEYKRFLK
ncbi:MAG TPA: Fic family protein [Candidatus Nitrosotalea sp.]|nr:Fic family protein [Candidatus Nitrosotalea sp.]